MYYVIFDTETLGLPKSYKGSPKDLTNFPQCIELAWGVYQNELLTKKGYGLIAPCGWQIPDTQFHRDHGFTQLDSEAFGMPIGMVLDEFIRDVDGCGPDCVLVAHNMQFDSGVMASEFIREGIRRNLDKIDLTQPAVDSARLMSFALQFKHKPQKLCTMEAGMNHFKIPKAASQTYAGSAQWKFPKLDEAYKLLFDKEPEQSHRANADTATAAAVFFELKRLGVITINEPILPVQSPETTPNAPSNDVATQSDAADGAAL